MPLVFVHGVNVRKGETEEEQARFAEGERHRDDLFREVSLAGIVAPPAILQIKNPYWGDFGARFRFDLVSVPTQGVESFGPGDELMARVLEETLPHDATAAMAEAKPIDGTFLLTLARRHSLAVAVDALIAASALDVPGEGEGAAAPSGELAAFAARAMRYAESSPDLSWLAAPATDDEFVERLLLEVPAAPAAATTKETFGGIKLTEGLKRAARKLGRVASTAVKATMDAAKGIVHGAVGAVVGGAGGVVGGVAIAVAPNAIVGAVRPVATRRAGQFFGDVFAYLGNRKPIQQIVTQALLDANAKRDAADPRLVVVAHSMGGNIVYDLLTSVLAGKLRVDAFVTVGSQVGLFKELALYTEDAAASRAGAAAGTAAPARVPKPAGIGTWINVFDPIDVLGFAAAGVFTEVSDFAFSNETSPLDAHSLYFFRPRFHQRLRARLAAAGLGSA
ncbi:MAG TPA: hypothetical protein VHG32_06030 [Thermoanaerobaculia bacterium]|jgi:hypothetical protein|nr:hypothetical protein [Thermoanaerobaculia bacterium]